MKQIAAFGLLLLVMGGPAAADQLTPVDAAEFRAELEARKGQVVLVNFWATWCRPCLKELPELLALERRYAARGVTLLPVSLDDPGDLQSVVSPFLVKWFPGMNTLARTTPDMDALVSVLDGAWNEVLPTSYLLDRTGRVRARLQGGMPANDFEAPILALLEGTGP